MHDPTANWHAVDSHAPTGSTGGARTGTGLGFWAPFALVSVVAFGLLTHLAGA